MSGHRSVFSSVKIRPSNLRQKNMAIDDFCRMLPLPRDLLLMVYKRMCATLKYCSNSNYKTVELQKYNDIHKSKYIAENMKC